MLVEFNSYSINDKVITLYCTNVEDIFDRNRHYPQEVMYSFDTSKKYQTRTLMNWLLKNLKGLTRHGEMFLHPFLERL